MTYYRKLAWFIMLMFLCFQIVAQVQDDSIRQYSKAELDAFYNANGSYTVFFIAHKMPSFDRGAEYISQLLNEALLIDQNEKEIKIIFQFAVNQKGKCGRTRILISDKTSYDKKLVAFFNAMQDWHPGMDRKKTRSCCPRWYGYD